MQLWLLLIAVLAGVPGAASAADAGWSFGAAGAHLEVLPYDRDPMAVDVVRLLPPGTAVYPAAAIRRSSVALTVDGGGRPAYAEADLIETRNPATRGMVALRQGRLPEVLDEIAIAPPVARRLGLLLGDARLRANALVRLPSSRYVRVVGLAERPDCPGCATAVGLPTGLLAAVSRPHPAQRSVTYVLELPELSPHERRALIDRLSIQGIKLRSRPAITPHRIGFPLH